MADGMSFSFPSLLFHEGRTYGQPEVVPISLPQVATGLRSRLPGSFRRRGFQPDLLMPQEALFAREAHSMQAAMCRALLRRGRSGNTAFSKTESNVAGNLCRIRQKDVETKKRTHRLCQIGGAVESVLGSAIEEEDIPKLIGFLKRQEANGKFFSKAMQKEPVANTEEV